MSGGMELLLRITAVISASNAFCNTRFRIGYSSERMNAVCRVNKGFTSKVLASPLRCAHVPVISSRNCLSACVASAMES